MANLKTLGFKTGKDIALLPRLIMSVSGLEKQGKTHFGLTAPGPIAFINLDDGLEGVIQKHTGNKEIHLLDLVLPDATVPDEDLIIEHASGEWAKFHTAYYGALRSDDIRSIVVDTATELRELQLMSIFGRAAQIMPYMYRDPNAKFRRLVRDAFKFDKSVIFLNKMRPVYINDKRTSDYEPSGFNDLGYLTQVNARVYQYAAEDGGEFAFYFENCRQNPELNGQEFPGPLCAFAMIAQMVLPDVDPDAWE